MPRETEKGPASWRLPGRPLDLGVEPGSRPGLRLVEVEHRVAVGVEHVVGGAERVSPGARRRRSAGDPRAAAGALVVADVDPRASARQ